MLTYASVKIWLIHLPENFIREHDLVVGDSIMVFKDCQTGKYVSSSSWSLITTIYQPLFQNYDVQRWPLTPIWSSSLHNQSWISSSALLRKLAISGQKLCIHIQHLITIGMQTCAPLSVNMVSGRFIMEPASTALTWMATPWPTTVLECSHTIFHSLNHRLCYGIINHVSNII